MDIEIKNDHGYLISLVDRARPGLVDHSECFVEYARVCGWQAKHMATSGYFDARWVAEVLQQAWGCRAPPILVIWSNGLSALMVCIIARLLLRRLRTVVVFHEPGGLFQRLRKRDPLSYSIALSVYEWIRAPFISSLFCPSPIAARTDSRVQFAPLLFKTNFRPWSGNKLTILHLGRRDYRRASNILVEIEPNLKKSGIDVEYFPRIGVTGFSNKALAISRAWLVFNPYCVRYNLSGVTCEAIANGVPVLVSVYDPYAEELHAIEPLLVLPANMIDGPSRTVRVQELTQRLSGERGIEIRHRIASLGEENFGVDGFKKYWHRPLAQLSNELIKNA